ncbi:MAG: carbohydrate ABC transporter permease [Chloroflexota bacterium]
MSFLSAVTSRTGSQPASGRMRLLWRALPGIARFLFFAILVLIFVIPFAWMILGSLREESEIFQFLYPLTLKTFVPVKWSLDSYLTVLGLNKIGQEAGLQFGRYLLNSAIVASGVVTSSLFFNTLGAYFFARLDFPAKNVLLVFVIATMLVPWQATIVPLYLVVKKLGLTDSLIGLMIPWYASPFVIFSLIQFFAEIPKELDEAAIIDGSGYWGILWRIIVPNSLPGLITNALLEFQFIWNLFFWPLIAISKKDLYVIQVAIQSQTTQTQIFWGRTFAGCSLASVPVIILFLAMQRYYVQGVATTGLKG